MRARRLRLMCLIVGAVIVGAAQAAGCLVAISPLERADAAVSTDAAEADAGPDGGDAALLSDADATVAPFDCQSIDATFCDDFNRDAPLVPGEPWSDPTECVATNPDSLGCSLVVDGTLVTTCDASTGIRLCYLTTGPLKNTSFYTLDFDVSFNALQASDPAVVVGVNFPRDASAPDAYEETFFLYVDGNGFSKVGVQDSYREGGPYGYNLAAADTPFVSQSSACHVTLSVNPLTPTAQAQATCGNIVTKMTPQLDSGAPAGFLAAPTLQLGFRNPSVSLPAWSVTYDNVVFQASP